MESKNWIWIPLIISKTESQIPSSQVSLPKRALQYPKLLVEKQGRTTTTIRRQPKYKTIIFRNEDFRSRQVINIHSRSGWQLRRDSRHSTDMAKTLLSPSQSEFLRRITQHRVRQWMFANPTCRDFETALKSIQSFRAPGVDNISLELIKHDRFALKTRIYLLLLRIWEKEKFLSAFTLRVFHK